MRTVVSTLFISLDGVTESPDQWQFDVLDDDMMADMGSELDKADAVLLGRVTYEEWAPYWPTATDEPFATFINNTPKYVVSNTLETVEWGNFKSVTLIKGSNLVEAITNLKKQPGKNITISGSASLVQSLLELDLLDELRLVIHPVVAGKGKRLFKDGVDVKQLTLLENKTTSTGVVILGYKRRESPAS